MNVDEFKNVIIGSGEGGKFLAWNLAKKGESTIVIERSMIGGSCPNIACLPSKNLIHSAKAIALADPKTGIGVLKGSLEIDRAGIVRRMQEMIAGLTRLHLDNFKASGAELLMGDAKFVGPRTVNVILIDGTSRQLLGENVIICVGSRAQIPNTPGLIESRPMTHIEALNLEHIPDHLVVLGGGYIGLEFAQSMRRFGSRVTIVQRGKTLLDREDDDVSEALLALMHDEGIEVLLESEVSQVLGVSGDEVTLTLRGPNGHRKIEASDILVAAGRIPNTDRIDAARGGVELDARGYVKVNDRLQTTAPAVWAVGDCAGSPQFTHAGFDDFRIVLSNLTGGNRTTSGRLIPYCLFTDPELSHIGMNEREANALGVPYRLFKIPMGAVLRTRTLSQTRGFAKALVGNDDRVLGFTAFGAETSEMLAAIQTGMLGNLPYTTLRDAIFTHPTTAEGLVVLFSSTPSQS